ncbi:flagellar filament capping protein FliD [Acidihalobacter prosperus]|uniref:Flagellar hook-associated protein 2 n=1 Tax=Acidihalobacter prosperus TaxID=160660 RepID=A0A1A6C5J6_9GAMM|nr:flagellar filament capping protein FliD [Acidihalobacter prosperus]OBS09833.1 Flagellar hook-associated protein FliD [Acidihalobacter prosperus]
MSGIISSPGVGSGLNVKSIVSQLLQADFGPQQTLLTNQQNGLNAQLSAFGAINSDVSSVNSTLQALGSLTQSYNASSSNNAVVTATSDGTATPGSYNVSVTALAQAQSLASSTFSSATASIGTGTLTFQFGSYNNATTPPTFTANSATSPTSITIDSSNNTLQGLADAINQANFGVSATIINNGSGYQLSLTSSAGTDHQLNITDSGSSLGAFTYSGTNGASTLSQTVAAQNAQLSLNGVAISSQSNTVTNAVTGVTLNLLGLTSGSPVAVTVGPNTGAVTQAVQSFVNAYNSFAKDVTKYASYDSKTKTAGVLLGDPTVRNLVNLFQNGVVQRISGAPAQYQNLMALGITANTNGTLSLDTSKLSAAMTSDYSGVVTALQTIGTQLGSTVGSMVGPNGIITARTNSINQQLTNIQKQFSDLSTRMQQEQTTLMQQYTAMDTLVANLKNTSSYLTSQLGSLPSASSSTTPGG